MVTFNNGKAVKERAVWALDKLQLHDAYRRVIEIQIPEEEITVAELYEIYQNRDACSVITISSALPQNAELNRDTSGGGIETEGNILRASHFNYTIPVQCGKKEIDGEQFWYMQLAEETPVEIAERKRNAEFDVLWAAFGELSAKVYGTGEEASDPGPQAD